MSKELIIAEKRTAGTELASVLDDPEFKKMGYKNLLDLGKKNGYLEGDNFLISWASGHLFREKLPSEINPAWGLFTPFKTSEEYKMPSLRENIKKTPTEEKNKERQRKILKFLLNRKDVIGIINACDADSEGEGIFMDIYIHLGGKVRNLPVNRFWNTGSYKSKIAVTKAMNSLLPANTPKYAQLYANKMARSNGDFCIGMKLTKVLCDSYNKQFYIGRVKGVCIGLVGDRSLEIDNFVSKPYWKVEAIHQGLTLKSFFYVEEESVDKDGNNIQIKRKEENYFEKNKAELCVASVKKNFKLTVIEYSKKDEAHTSPALPLSGDDFKSNMMKKYKVPNKVSEEILDYLRKEGFTTYPGTNGNYFQKSEAAEVQESLSIACKYFNISLPFSIESEVFNDKKAADQNHSPLTVTEEMPTDKDIEKWSKEKIPFLKEGYELIAKHIISKFLPENLISAQNLVANTVDGNLFFINGKSIIRRGWMDFMEAKSEDTSFNIPGLSVGSEISIDDVKLLDKKTTVPKPHTVDSLMSTLQNVSRVFDEYISEAVEPDKIAKLKKQRAQLRNAKGIGTDRTRGPTIDELIKNGIFTCSKTFELALSPKGKELYTVCPREIRSVIFTSVWEIYFEDIRKGNMSYSAFMKNMDNYLMEKMIPKVIQDIGTRVKVSEKKISEKKKVSNVYCPLCRSDILENDKLFFCEKGSTKKIKGCAFVLFKDANKVIGRSFDGESGFTDFIESTKENPIKGKGNAFWFNPKKKYMTEIHWDAEAVADENGLIETEKVFKYKDKILYKNLMGVPATKEEALKLLSGESLIISRIGKKKNTYRAKVTLSKKGGKVDVEFLKAPAFGEEDKE